MFDLIDFAFHPQKPEQLLGLYLAEHIGDRGSVDGLQHLMDLVKGLGSALLEQPLDQLLDFLEDIIGEEEVKTNLCELRGSELVVV